MKVAILHEMLIKLGWAEKVVENFMKLFPEADIFTLIYEFSYLPIPYFLFSSDAT